MSVDVKFQYLFVNIFILPLSLCYSFNHIRKSPQNPILHLLRFLQNCQPKSNIHTPTHTAPTRPVHHSPPTPSPLQSQFHTQIIAASILLQRNAPKAINRSLLHLPHVPMLDIIAVRTYMSSKNIHITGNIFCQQNISIPINLFQYMEITTTVCEDAGH